MDLVVFLIEKHPVFYHRENFVRMFCSRPKKLQAFKKRRPAVFVFLCKPEYF